MTRPFRPVVFPLPLDPHAIRLHRERRRGVAFWLAAFAAHAVWLGVWAIGEPEPASPAAETASNAVVIVEWQGDGVPDAPVVVEAATAKQTAPARKRGSAPPKADPRRALQPVEAPEVQVVSVQDPVAAPQAAPAATPTWRSNPVMDLRDALGFEAPVATKSELVPATASRGLAYEPFANDAPEQDYLHAMNDAILSRWNAMDLPTHEKALGIQGRSTITFEVHRSGQVAIREVTNSSGVALLDDMALRAVGDKFPRFPRSFEQERLIHRVRLVYANPLLGR